MPEVLYIIPKIGTGSWDNPIRPAYEAEIKQALGIRSGVRLQRKMDDPFDYKTGFGIYAFIDAPVGAEDVLESQPGVVRLGADPTTALSTLRFRALTNVREDAWVRSKTDAQVIKTLTVRRQSLGLTHGTDTTDFTDSDGTTWDSLSTNALTKTHFSGTDGNTTFDVSSNQGAATGVVGGGFYQSEDVWIQDGVTPAEDMVCTLTHVSGPVNSTNDWIKFIGRYNSSGHFFYMENQDQGGDDTRLFEYISGTGANQLDTSTFTAAATSRTFQMTIATNGATDADIDCQVNGTDRINFSGTINAGLRSTSGHTGIYSLSSRNSAHVVDTLAMTNNDAGGVTFNASPVVLDLTPVPPSFQQTVSASPVALTLTPVPPSFKQTISASPVALTLTPVQPATAGIRFSASPVSLTLTPVSPTFAQQVSASPVVLTLMPVTPTFVSAQTYNASPVALTLTPVAPAFQQKFYTSPVQLVLTPVAATARVGLLASPLQLVLTPVQPSFSQKFYASPVVLDLTPVPATFAQAVSASPVLLELSVPTPTFTIGTLFNASPVQLVLSPVAPLIQQRFHASPGSLLLTPVAPSFQQTLLASPVVLLLTIVGPSFQAPATAPTDGIVLLVVRDAGIGSVTMRDTDIGLVVVRNRGIGLLTVRDSGLGS